MAYCIPNGILGAWLGAMAMNFKPLGISNEESGTIGTAAIGACSVIGIVTAYLIDHIKKQMKLCLVIALGKTFYSRL